MYIIPRFKRHETFRLDINSLIYAVRLNIGVQASNDVEEPGQSLYKHGTNGLMV